ncbi:MAG: nitrilase family protein [Bacteroidaceae bacterium]|nr:nitrilase family protein [Bacteroidaceae bacterium]
MKVTLIQMDIVWEAPEVNCKTAERLMRSAEKSDVYVLPEMWNTGVTTEPQRVAPIPAPLALRRTESSPIAPLPTGDCPEEEGSSSLQWMQRMANELDAAVVGSIAVASPLPCLRRKLPNCSAINEQLPPLGECSYRNRLYFVMPQETVKRTLPQEFVNCKSSNCKFYDKHHLFAYGGETKNYTPGNEYVTVEWRGVRFHLCVCYDLRFPLWLRNRDDYDVLICVASWPAVRLHAWNVLLQARAIENQCYVLGVNRIGKDPYCEYCGGTSVVDFYGMATSCPDGEASVLTQILDLKRLKAFREKFPVLKERD